MPLLPQNSEIYADSAHQCLYRYNFLIRYRPGAFADDQIPTATNLMEAMSRHFRPEFLGRLGPVGKDNADTGVAGSTGIHVGGDRHTRSASFC